MNLTTVIESPVYDNFNNLLVGYKAINNKKTGQNYSVATKIYQPVQHGIADETVCKAIGMTGARVTGVTHKETHDGARLHVRYKVNVRQTIVGDSAYELYFDLYNSHDKSLSFMLESSVRRMFCLNECTMLSGLERFRHKHTSGLNHNLIAESVTKQINNFKYQLGTKIDNMKRVPCDATTLLTQMNTHNVFANKYIDSIYNRAIGKGIDNADASNVYDCYNAMTETFTHDIEDNNSLKRKYLLKADLFTESILMKEVA